MSTEKRWHDNAKNARNCASNKFVSSNVMSLKCKKNITNKVGIISKYLIVFPSTFYSTITLSFNWLVIIFVVVMLLIRIDMIKDLAINLIFA